MPARDFGGMIRENRERLGLTSARVAELVGRAPATVKTWERGHAVPTDSEVITSLAAVLDIDERDLFRAAGVEPPTEERSATIEESLASIAPRSNPSGGGEWSLTISRDHPPEVHPRTDDDRVGSIGARISRRRDWRRHLETAGAFVRSARARIAEAIEKLEKERQQTPPAVDPPAAPLPPPGARSYLEDPDQRLTYRLRGIFTAIGLAVIFVVLVWAGSNALEALGETWDSLLGGF